MEYESLGLLWVSGVDRAMLNESMQIGSSQYWVTASS